MTYLVLTVLAIISGLFGWKALTNAKTTEALADNNKVKENLKQTDVKISDDRAALKSEEELRNQLKADIESHKNEEETPANILDFFNNRK